MDRIFLDATILFSAAYLEVSGLARLWTFDDVELLSSAYAIVEARRNLLIDRHAALPRFERLTARVSIVDAPRDRELPAGLRLDPKDRPILMAAIHGQADFLLTGDARHFAHLYSKRVSGVLVLRPAQYFARRR